MKIYLVGGAIRNKLLGLPVTERDWVVVGATPEVMIQQGFKPVGKAFPVFLHPDTHEEYALARTERKVGKGYKGFTFYTDPSITLEQDLERRDLTINAIAQDGDGTLIDPYGGQQDLEKKRLQHVSPAFSEDPVRILRIARFAAKLPDFHVAPLTNTLMTQMVQTGEVNALVAERVWQEWAKSLSEPMPSRFFEVLDACGAMTTLFPELHNINELIDHPALNPIERFACLLHACSETEMQSLIQRYRVPTQFRTLAFLAKRLSPDYSALDSGNPSLLLSFIKDADLLRRPERLDSIVSVLTQITHANHANLLNQALIQIKAIDSTTLQNQGLTGRAFADALQRQQIDALKSFMRSN